MNSIFISIVLVLLLTSCSPLAATQTTVSAVSTQELSASSTAVVSTSTVIPSLTEEIFPTFTPAPTSTPIAPLRAGQSIRLAAIHMSDEQDGWGIDSGDHIVHTTDGGLTWKDVTPHNGAYRDSGFFMLDAVTAWATPYQDACYTENCAPAPNNASVWHTTDGGNTWQEEHICLQSQECDFDFDVPSEAYFPITLQFLDEKTGWLVVVVDHMMNQDRYRLYKTVDSGAHWSPVIDSFMGPMTTRITGLAFENSKTGWMSTSDILGPVDPVPDWSIYQSTDAGLTWNRLELPEPDPLPETFAQKTPWCGAQKVNSILPDGLGVTIHCIFLEEDAPMDFYFYSANEGKAWISWQQTGNVDFINASDGWRMSALGESYLIERTHDGGQTWAKVKNVTWNGNLDFVNEQTGWAIATSGDAVSLVHTADGGQSWDVIKPTVEAP